MEYKISENEIILANDNNETLAYVTFPYIKPGVVEITHTVVSESLKGQGIAGKLMEMLYNELKDRGLKAKLTCSYAVVWYEKNPSKKDILM